MVLLNTSGSREDILLRRLGTKEDEKWIMVLTIHRRINVSVFRILQLKIWSSKDSGDSLKRRSGNVGSSEEMKEMASVCKE